MTVMDAQLRALETTLPAAVDRATISQKAATPAEDMAALVLRFAGEFRDMPGLRLTLRQAARLFGVESDIASAVLEELRRAAVLALSNDGRYALIGDDKTLGRLRRIHGAAGGAVREQRN